MSILSFLRGKKLKPTWSYETRSEKEIIWKLLVNPDGLLTGEERNVEAKTGSLFALDSVHGNVLWKDVTVTEPWWFGSELATQTSLYLQTFRKPDLPEPLGIIALDIQTGQIRWQQPEMTFLFEHASGVAAMRQFFSAREYYLLNVLSGEIVQEFGESDDRVRELRSETPESDLQARYADLLEPDSPYFAAASELLKNSLAVEDLRGPIEFLEYENLIVLSYHVRSRVSGEAMLRNLLSNELLVLDRTTGDVLYRETLHRQTPLPLPDNFFVHGSTLIYVKEKRSVVGIRLT